jgi:hypothetical protein
VTFCGAAPHEKGDKKRMGIIVAYLILALLLLALSTGMFKPKKWNELTERHVKFLKIGCFFGFLVIVVNIVSKLL